MTDPLTKAELRAALTRAQDAAVEHWGIVRREDGKCLAVATLEAREKEASRILAGPVHGRIQTARGMCTDEIDHVEIDALLGDAVDALADARAQLEERTSDG